MGSGGEEDSLINGDLVQFWLSYFHKNVNSYSITTWNTWRNWGWQRAYHYSVAKTWIWWWQWDQQLPGGQTWEEELALDTCQQRLCGVWYQTEGDWPDGRLCLPVPGDSSECCWQQWTQRGFQLYLLQRAIMWVPRIILHKPNAYQNHIINNFPKCPFQELAEFMNGLQKHMLIRRILNIVSIKKQVNHYFR